MGNKTDLYQYEPTSELGVEETKEIESSDVITFITPQNKSICLNKHFLQNYWKDEPVRYDAQGVIWADCVAVKQSDGAYETENEVQDCKPYWIIPGDANYFVDRNS